MSPGVNCLLNTTFHLHLPWKNKNILKNTVNTEVLLQVLTVTFRLKKKKIAQKTRNSSDRKQHEQSIYFNNTVVHF